MKTQEGIRIVPLDDVLYLEANSPYSNVYLKGGKKVFCIDNLKMFDERLKSFGFFRIHKRHLINVNLIEVVVKDTDPYVKMIGGAKLKLSRIKKSVFYEYLDKFYF